MNNTEQEKKENSWVEEKGKSIDLLCSLREISTLYAIRNSLEEKLKECSVIGQTEYDFCSMSARIYTLNEVILEINDKILKATDKKD